MRAALLSLALTCWWAAADAQVFEPSRFISLGVTVLRVEAPSGAGVLKAGTAITVAPGVVVTNCHVTRDAMAVRLARGAGQWLADGQFADAVHDLCFLSVPGWPGKPVRFADAASLRLYQPVVAMGFTRGADVSISPGEITGLHGHDGGLIIQTTSSFSSGASGGALLDADGGLIGVLTFRMRGSSDHYFSVPASWVSARLPIAANQFQPIGALQGRAFWEDDACCLPYFMRADPLTSQEKWPELLRLAEEWIAADPSDADAWFARGLAHARLRQPRDAAGALERTVSLAPRKAIAWYELGAASIENADTESVARAAAALVGLGSALARKLSEKAQQEVAPSSGADGCGDCRNPER